MDKQLHYFCGSPFWDEYQTWNTTDPDFSVCFHQTVLVWIPCAFLWLLTPLEIVYLVRQQFQHIPWSPLIFFKLILTAGLIVLCCLQLAHKLTTDTGVYLADYWAAGIKLVTYLLSAILVIAGKKQGLNSSGVLFIFWFVAAVCGAFTYRSYFSGSLAEDRGTDNYLYVTNLILFPLILAQLVAAFFPDTVITHISKQKECPYHKASFPSLCFFSWFDPVVWKGFRHGLKEEDMWTLDEQYRSAYVYNKTEDYCNKFKEKKSLSKKPPSFLRLLWELNKFEFCMGFFLKIFADICAFTNPLLLRLLIDFVSNPAEPNWKGYMYTGIMLVAAIITSMANHNYFFRLQSIGIGARAAVISTIYRKALRMSTAAKKTATTGEVVNLMSVDAQRVMDVWPYVGYLITTPITISLAIFLLWQLMGPAILAGLAVICIAIPTNLFLARIISRYQTQLMAEKDQRIKLVNELLSGIKILKLYAWEISFNKKIQKIRARELRLLKKILYLEATTNFIFMFSPFLISLATFATYVLTDERNVLDAAKAFVSLALFDLIRFPLALIPMILSYIIQAMTSLKRLDKFMANDELDQKQVTEESSQNVAVLIENGTFTWALEDAPVLRSINLQCAPGNLIAVVGTVGSGKSSLISAILGEMEKLSGRIVRKGSIAYVSQQAWIQNATLMDNILFGKPKDNKKYDKVLDFCCLKPDLQVLPGGDLTEIGEKGINLSGGQKQRVALARAVYSDADLFLLDDPLSAVDAHVGKEIFDKVIGPKGILRGKTRILVTHGISYLPHVDIIVVLNNGVISETGSYKHLLAKSGAFADFLMTYLKEEGEIDDVEAAELLEIQEGLLSDIENPEVKKKLSRRITRALSSDEECAYERRPSYSRSSSITSFRRRSSVGKEDRRGSTHTTPPEKGTAVLITKEQMEIGSVGWRVYMYYFRSCSLLMCAVAVGVFCLSWSSSVGSNVWLSLWSNDGPNPDGTQNIDLRNVRLGVYSALGAGQVTFSFIAAIILLRSTVRASSSLHGNMAVNILHSPMSFFDTTPLGRILNRFSRDVDVVDVTIPLFLRPLIDFSLQIIGVVIVICVSTPMFVIALLPLSALYYFIQRIFIDTSRQLKRMESVSRSPIFSHFAETLAGLSTIRAYKIQRQFIRTSDERVDSNNALFYPFLVAKRWLGVKLELVGSLVVFCAALFAVIGRNTLEPGTVGLSVTYALSVTLVLNMLVRNWTEVESNSISIERLKEYTEVKTEAPWEIPDKKPPADWPDTGTVKFNNYRTRYREGLDDVLKGISCDIHSGEKIGIVGRTGAGKSSLTLALFRIIEASGGSITIDGVDIASIGLHDLRSRLTIIPQDPVLFCGTIRLNLDPFDTCTTAEIWRALEQSHLKDFVASLSAGLDHEITEGGENLSVGQRQLICLARALLRKSKILILDEATAAVDLETDDLIQATIRREFVDCTVITIAHRINTILDNTRVMVLENGVIKEFSDPKELLANKNSVFYSMASDAGLV